MSCFIIFLCLHSQFKVKSMIVGSWPMTIPYQHLQFLTNNEIEDGKLQFNHDQLDCRTIDIYFTAGVACNAKIATMSSNKYHGQMTLHQ